MLFALYRLGYKGKMTGHGFRAVASTILNEAGFQPDVIERQLAHCERNQVRGAYNRAEYLPERKRMMQHWADYLDRIAAGAKIISLHGGAAFPIDSEESSLTAGILRGGLAIGFKFHIRRTCNLDSAGLATSKNPPNPEN
jgi:hypothetical protein